MASDAIEIVAVQLPGREDRLAESPLRSLPEIAGQIAPIIAGAHARPFALFGHSFGARLAVHVASLLVSAGVAPQRLFLSGARWLLEPGQAIHSLGGEAFRRTLAERFGFLPAALTADPTLWALFEPSLRADFEALETDTLAALPLPVPLTLVAGTRDQVAGIAKAADWQTWSDRPVTVEIVDADHFSFRSDPAPYLDVIARWLLQDGAGGDDQSRCGSEKEYSRSAT